jgi:hypothetical protein
MWGHNIFEPTMWVFLFKSGYKIEATIPVSDPYFSPYKNTHSHIHEHPNIRSMGHAFSIVGIYVDNLYWLRGNHCN